MRSSKLIMKNIAHKVMAKFGFICRFHDLKYIQAKFFYQHSLKSLKIKGVITKICRKNINFMNILSYFKQILDTYVLNISTCILICTVF